MSKRRPRRFGGLGVVLLCAATLVVAAPVAAAETGASPDASLATNPEASPATSPEQEHLAIGMFSLESDAGGAVWAFRDDDVVRLIGPGEAFARGDWNAPDGDDRRFSGSIEVKVSDQTLTFKGEASTDGSAIAILVTATEPGFDAGKFNWPLESRLVGKRVGFRQVEPEPSPSPDAGARPGPSPSPDAGAQLEPSLSPGTGARPEPSLSPGASAQPLPLVAPTAIPASIRSVDGECAIWDGIDGVAWGVCEA